MIRNIIINSGILKFADMVFAFEVCFALLPLLGLKQTQAGKEYICFLSYQ